LTHAYKDVEEVAEELNKLTTNYEIVRSSGDNARKDREDRKKKREQREEEQEAKEKEAKGKGQGK